MLNDLTSAFLAKMTENGATPIQLAIFYFDSGIVYLSDRDIIISGQLYKGLVESWGTLQTVGAENAISSTQEIDLIIWNGEPEYFFRTVQYNSPVNTFVEIYQGYDGLSIEDYYLLGEFVIQDNLEEAEASYLIKIGLVSSNMRYMGQVGTILKRSTYPKSLESHLNRSIDLIIGDTGEVECLCSSKPPSTTMLGSILKSPTKVYVHDDLQELSFILTSAYIQIDDEIMRYSNCRFDGTYWYFNVVERGAAGSDGEATKAVDHSDGAEIIQAKQQVEYIVGLGPITSINNVKVAGKTPLISYNVYPSLNPAKIVFDRQPYKIEYSKGARNIVVDFDKTEADNTAYKAFWAWDDEYKSLGAIIERYANRTTLSVTRQLPPIDDGQIVNIFLDVEHWATKSYTEDSVYVIVEGVNGPKPYNAIGILNKPNPKDIFDLGGVIDLQHGHGHQSGGNHDHNFTDSKGGLTDNQHLHAADLYVIHKDHMDKASPYYIHSSSHVAIYFPSYSNVKKRELYVRFKNNAIEYTNIEGYKFEGHGSFSQTFPVDSYKVDIRTGGHLNISPLDPYGCYVYEMIMTTTTDGAVYNNTANVSVNPYDGSVNAVGDYLTDQGNIGGLAIKDENDVDDLPSTDVELETTLKENAGRSVVQSFDVTEYLQSVDWEFMRDLNVKLKYVSGTGSTETPEIIVTYINFRVEYRQRQIVTTDEVTCSPVNNEIENRPDAVIQYLLTEKAGLDTSKLSSVYRDIPIMVDDDTLYDDDVLYDAGQVTDVPTGALFEEAGSWFANRNYKLDGIISGNLSVKEAIKNISWQTRCKLLWTNGKAKLTILRKSEGWLIAKSLTTSDILLQSRGSKLSPVSEVINHVDLFYMLNRLSSAEGAEKYMSSTNRVDQDSIDRNGERKDDDKFLFDLIRDRLTAEDIADYYIWYLGEPIVYQSFNTFLDNFDIEKHDYIKAPTVDGKEIALMVSELVRNFGSGKHSKMNTLSIIASAIRIKMHRVNLPDIISVGSALDVSLGFLQDLSENINITDEILFGLGRNLDDGVTVNDVLTFLFLINPKLTDTAEIQDTLSAHMEMTLTDSVSIHSNLFKTFEQCAGSYGFGVLPFGGLTIYRFDNVDLTDITDQLVANFGLNLSNTVTLDDDDMTFSDGYGSTSLGDGYDEIYYGE